MHWEKKAHIQGPLSALHCTEVSHIYHHNKLYEIETWYDKEIEFPER